MGTAKRKSQSGAVSFGYRGGRLHCGALIGAPLGLSLGLHRGAPSRRFKASADLSVSRPGSLSSHPSLAMSSWRPVDAARRRTPALAPPVLATPALAPPVLATLALAPPALAPPSPLVVSPPPGDAGRTTTLAPRSRTDAAIAVESARWRIGCAEDVAAAAPQPQHSAPLPLEVAVAADPPEESLRLPPA